MLPQYTVRCLTPNPTGLMNDRGSGKIRIIAVACVALSIALLLGIRWNGDAYSASMDDLRGSSLAEVAAVQPPQTVVSPPRSGEAEALQRARELSGAFTSIADTVTPAVVRIQSEHRLDAARGTVLRGLLGEGAPQNPPQMPDVGGTGVIVTGDGFILTNYHVIAGADAISVSTMDKQQFTARLVGADPSTDVAVLKIEADGLPVARLGDSEQTRVGEWVLAVGNPGFGTRSRLDFTVTGGIISAKGRPLQILGRELNRQGEGAPYTIEDFIQTDAVINPGNSGGPLLNLDGEVIGITTAIASDNGFYQGYGFAIPINLARRVMLDLTEHGHVRRALLGVMIDEVDAESAEVYGLDEVRGVLVQDFPPDSPARDAGLRRHDVIVAVDQEPVQRLAQLQRLVAHSPPGQKVRVTVVRYGETRHVDIRLQEAPAVEAAGRPASGETPREEVPPGADALGLVLTEGTAEAANRLGIGGSEGAYVLDVAPFGPADRKEMEPGDRILSIDRTPIESAAKARAVLGSAERGAVVSFTLRGMRGQTRIANIRMP